ncbi:MalY/PatB family protein [Pseudahrensia aquimaris]|uniref:cysteine-S-conjugate beta-lyase n=1 Tax=Pseudahrensia aquimaris TaxID=744461 RepID=A0ABW3F9G9_9HYPH
MNFDQPIERRDTHCAKWDMMEKLYNVPREDGLAMWVADMEFKAADPIQRAVQEMHDHGVYGYFGDDAKYKSAIQWWMKNRHGWEIEPDWIFTTHGLVNGTAMCVDTYTEVGDAIVLFTPVYHAFAKVIKANNRTVTELPLALTDGRYTMDFSSYDALLTGKEKMLILCSPHNPGGRVWTKSELAQVAAFAKKHDLILVSDEIHCDLVFGGTTHIPMANIEGVSERLVMMNATTKTFNIAGSHSGNVIIPDADLRARFNARMMALGISANSFGVFMATAAYTPEGAEWVDACVSYLDGNRKLFDEAINAVPGLASMNLEATYLAWVDFSGTGMGADEFTRRVMQDAKIAVNAGPTFGLGGESFLRFNIAAPRAMVEDACQRMQRAFADLQ